MRELTVATVMTKDPVTVAPDTELKDIVETLAKHTISAVAVVSRDGVPIGVVSEADLIRKQEQPGQKTTAERALHLMTVPVRAVGPDESVSFAARELNRRGVRRLFVIDHGRLVGVVSRRDLLKVFLRSDEEIRVDIEREVFQRVLWTDPHAITVSVDCGLATLTGQLDRRSEVEIAGRLTATIPGVVAVGKAASSSLSRWRSRSSNSRQSSTRGPSSRQKMSSASRSPCPSTTHPSAIRLSNKASRLARNSIVSRSISAIGPLPTMPRAVALTWSKLACQRAWIASRLPSALISASVPGGRVERGDQPGQFADWCLSRRSCPPGCSAGDHPAFFA